MGYIEEMSYWEEYHDARADLRRKWYVMDMSRGKKRIHASTKARQEIEFDDAVVKLAQIIEEGRKVVENPI